MFVSLVGCIVAVVYVVCNRIEIMSIISVIGMKPLVDTIMGNGARVVDVDSVLDWMVLILTSWMASLDITFQVSSVSPSSDPTVTWCQML